MLAVAPRDGGVLREAIRPDVLQRHPVRMVAAHPGVDRWRPLRSAESAGAALVDEKEMERLRALGYAQ